MNINYPKADTAPAQIDLDGYEIKPGIFLIGEATHRPDLGEHRYHCLADVHGSLACVRLRIRPRNKRDD